MEPTKLCTACKHCHAHPELLDQGESRLRQYYCFSPNNIIDYSPVDGSPEFIEPYCVEVRKDSYHLCCAEAKWFEPKPVPGTMVPINPTTNIKQVLKIKVGTNLLEDLGL